MVVMLQNEISQKKIALNTLMARDKTLFWDRIWFCFKGV
jgi:hypothetical protein